MQEKNLYARRAGISLNRHLPIERNISGSLCDLCASNESRGTREEWARDKGFS